MTPDNPYTHITLPCGLRLIHVHAPGSVEYCGVAVAAGSRDEPSHLHGLAHFVEHTIFKGTAKRRSWHIINRMEAVGGELNAYTTKEETMVYTIFPKGNLPRAAELLMDLVTSSAFPQAELDREREVVADEINSYLDTPSEAVFDEYEEVFFGDSPLAHNILGTIESVDRITSDDCRDYLRRFYRSGNMALFYAGPTPPAAVERVMARYTADVPGGSAERFHDRTAPPGVEPFTLRRALGSHQAHVVMGARLPGMRDADRYTLSLLTNILGGPGMNSRLNVALRERRGLVYTVEASTALLTDVGLFTVYFGCDPEDARKCMTLVQRELQRIADAPLSPIALERAKKQYLGQLTVAGDNREQMALSAGRATLYGRHLLTPDEVAQRIHAVDPGRLLDAARSLAHLSTLELS